MVGRRCFNTRYGTGVGGSQNLAFAAGGACAGGTNTTCTEEYNGATWSTKNGHTVARNSQSGAGTGTDIAIFGGFTNTAVTCTEEFCRDLIVTCQL